MPAAMENNPELSDALDLSRENARLRDELENTNLFLMEAIMEKGEIETQFDALKKLEAVHREVESRKLAAATARARDAEADAERLRAQVTELRKALEEVCVDLAVELGRNNPVDPNEDYSGQCVSLIQARAALAAHDTIAAHDAKRAAEADTLRRALDEAEAKIDTLMEIDEVKDCLWCAYDFSKKIEDLEAELATLRVWAALWKRAAKENHARAEIAEADAEGLTEALGRAQRLLSVCSFDAPEDLADLAWIDTALAAHDAVTGAGESGE